MALPKTFEDRMKKLLGEEYDSFVSSYQDKYKTGLRVNRLKLTGKEFEPISPCPVKPIPWTTNGYYYDGKNQPAKHPYYHAGLYYIQEPSAMLPAALLPIEPGDKVLDVCAAPGGKSTELAAKLGGTGLLVSNDISNSRAKALLKNIELFGVRNPVIISEDPANLVKSFTGYFDKILVDAPCSGEGMFRKDPSIMKNWEQYGVDYYNNLQKNIILYAADMLKPGGSMVYSTCTFSPEENEGSIQYLLNNREGFSVEYVERVEGLGSGHPEWIGSEDEQLKNCIRVWPHKVEGEGHFVVLLKKSPEVGTSAYGGYSYKKVKLSEEAVDFLEQLELDFDPNRFELREERLYYLPEGLPNVKGLRILRLGLYLGDMKKNRFEPSQALANALKETDYTNILNIFSCHGDAIKYLKCETLDLSENYRSCTSREEYDTLVAAKKAGVDAMENNAGIILETRKKNPWFLVCVDGFPLGWAKCNKNGMKNKYLAGWRWM
ncbi:RsmB/NOP family class I SAM-dependent RNA methyltransferase [Anaerosporobacter faecicola]|uniref:RsmB/NOP family class I SAM-dependent RNA methyltransferase n=1 Tax=Anaerosporobacter faecicola TaxID=2718714 RepID=UPI00143AEBB4|nr:RsmB/NOP family class I SAM-dependent RNA methyltransferase [Anaerosporobacter faecicola]